MELSEFEQSALDIAISETHPTKLTDIEYLSTTGRRCSENVPLYIYTLIAPFESNGNITRNFFVGCHGKAESLACSWQVNHYLIRDEVDKRISINESLKVNDANRFMDYLVSLSPNILIKHTEIPIIDGVKTISTIHKTGNRYSVIMLDNGCSVWHLEFDEFTENGVTSFVLNDSYQSIC